MREREIAYLWAGALPVLRDRAELDSAIPIYEDMVVFRVHIRFRSSMGSLSSVTALDHSRPRETHWMEMLQTSTDG